MRWLRLLLLGLASVYPLYWTTQFLLYFLPEFGLGYWLGRPVRILDLSYLQVLAVVRPHAFFPAYAEALAVAVLASILILYLRGDRFVSGALAIVMLGQASLVSFFNVGWAPNDAAFLIVSGSLAAFCLIIVGLYRILLRVGGEDFVERLALLNLVAVIPEALLWVMLRLFYPAFDTRILLALLVPLFLASVIACFLPATFANETLGSVPWVEIFASSAVAGLLLLAISLSGNAGDSLNSRVNDRGAAFTLSR
jgi:hypothetical protein